MYQIPFFGAGEKSIVVSIWKWKHYQKIDFGVSKLRYNSFWFWGFEFWGSMDLVKRFFFWKQTNKKTTSANVLAGNRLKKQKQVNSQCIKFWRRKLNKTLISCYRLPLNIPPFKYLTEHKRLYNVHKGIQKNKACSVYLQNISK